MEFRFFEKLPVYSVDIRNEVFVKEQGFCEEFDEVDRVATHIVGFVDDRSVATARVIKLSDTDFLIGRIAVRKAYRKNGYGAVLIAEAEKFIKDNGGNVAYIHAQIRAMPFYEKQGYTPFGEPDEEEGCPHQMMKKLL